MLRTIALIFCFLNSILVNGSIFAQDKPSSSEPTIQRISVEISKKGAVILSLNPVPDKDFEIPEGKKVNIYGFPSADCFDDNGFSIINFNFTQKKNFILPLFLGKNLELKNDANGLLFDTSFLKDAISQKISFDTKRKFGFPFTMEWDITKHGSISRNQASESARSFNFNFVSSNLEKKVYLFFSIQPTDTKYTSGIIRGYQKTDNEPPKELDKFMIQNGKASYNFQLANFPENPTLGWWTTMRGDNAIVKRLRIAGPIFPTLGIEMISQGGKVVISKVDTDSPASKSGIKMNDILLSLNGEKIRDASTAKEIINTAPLTAPLEIEIKREEINQKIKVVPN